MRLENRLIGYIPRENAPAWSAYLARLEGAGYGARCSTVRIRAGWTAYWVNLRADPDAAYLLPEEEAERETERAKVAQERAASKAARERERTQKAAAREAARAERDAEKALEADRRAARLCISCGRPIGASSGPRAAGSALRELPQGTVMPTRQAPHRQPGLPSSTQAANKRLRLYQMILPHAA